MNFGGTMLVGRVLVIALAVGLANAFIASSAQAPHLAPRRDCLSPRVPPVVAAYSKKQRDPLNRLCRLIQVRTPYSLHPSAFTPRPLPTAAAAAATAPSRTRSQALPVHGIDALSSFDKPVAGRHRGRRAEGGATAHVDDPAHRAA